MTGDTAHVRNPRNQFQLVDAPAYLYTVGSIGITPIMAMAAEQPNALRAAGATTSNY
ncbi:hypothetical protein [Rhodococcus opacus]|uniref:hypothetical protein n=1 Tax=Rhodococcus opacus TaxID=37919 RepID=UPI000AE5784C|nr:hypothetical protein [Rhodococcus opacus]